LRHLLLLHQQFWNLSLLGPVSVPLLPLQQQQHVERVCGLVLPLICHRLLGWVQLERLEWKLAACLLVSQMPRYVHDHRRPLLQVLLTSVLYL
jgi:hypothetical protein